MKASRLLVSPMSSLSSRSMRLLQQSKLLSLSSSHHSYKSSSSTTTTLSASISSLQYRITTLCRQQQRNYVASSSPIFNIKNQNQQQQRTASTVAIPNDNMMEMIKELRNRTGAPIVDCKKAYKEAQKVLQEQQQEAEESLEKTNDIYTIAIDWLRRHTAIKTTNKVAGRTTNEGLIGLQITSSSSSSTETAAAAAAAAMVKVVSETDFAALSTNFLQFVQTVVTTTLQKNPPSIDALLLLQAQTQEGTESDNSKTMTIQDSLNDTIVSIRENISIADIQYMSSSTTPDTHGNGIISGYVHNNSSTTADISCGTAAAVVLLAPTSSSSSSSSSAATTKALSNEEIQMIGKQLAMHIVAAKPLYQSIEDIPSEVVEAERSILMEQIQKEMESKNASKPPNPTMMEKILMGKLQKFYSTICLMEQHHMIVDHYGKAITVKDYLQQQNLTLQRYIYMFI